MGPVLEYYQTCSSSACVSESKLAFEYRRHTTYQLNAIVVVICNLFNDLNGLIVAPELILDQLLSGADPFRFPFCLQEIGEFVTGVQN
jgi:hypothetical protein